MPDNYVSYHTHTDFSLLDSCSDYKLYVDKAAELGQKAICFSEHGKPLGWVGKKLYCDEKGIKYLHGVECYLTEDPVARVRDNYHTILIAKNEAGFHELNRAIFRSDMEDRFYYVNRLSFDDFLNLSDNILKISACLASPLNKLAITHPRYEELVKAYDYLEIQPHAVADQIGFNTHLFELGGKYHKPLIAGTDAHSVSPYKAECRKLLLKRKHKSYGDEDQFDLTYKSYDELTTAFEAQGCLPKNVYLEAIENTNLMADSVEELHLDRSIKYPIAYGSAEADSERFVQRVNDMFEDKLRRGIIPPEQERGFRDALAEEIRVFTKLGMNGFMLSMSEICGWCRENNIPLGPARGSVAGSRVAYAADIIDINPETFNTVFSRFCNEDREEIGDIDIDLIESDRPKVFGFIKEKYGSEKTARVASFGTIAEKGTIDDVVGGLRVMWAEEHGSEEGTPWTLSFADKVKAEYLADPDKARADYPEVFYYFDGMLGTRISQSVHPAGMVVAPLNLVDNYGVFHKDGEECLLIDMEDVHEVGLAKYDFLVLKNIEIISRTYKALGKPYPRVSDIDLRDPAVWADIIKSPVGIFQFEGSYAHQMLRKYKPKCVEDMCVVNAALRPSGASYRDDLIAGKPFKNPSPMIDELLSDTNGYLVYQEQTIAFLQKICGLSGSQADNVRRAIGRKQVDRLEAALPSILEGYCKNSSSPHDQAVEEAKIFLKIIEDSASYQFGLNHSIAYCVIGYICGYLRYYYPYEFITAYLNCAANEEDITNGTELARQKGIEVSSPIWGVFGKDYSFNKEQKVIARSLTSVKYMGSDTPHELEKIAAQNPKTFVDILYHLGDTTVDSRQLDILVRTRFFRQFGNTAELLAMIEQFRKLRDGHAKLISNEELDKAHARVAEIIRQNATCEGKDGKILKRWTILDCRKILDEIWSFILDQNIPERSIPELVKDSITYLGYIDLTTGKKEDRLKTVVTDVIPMKGKNGTYWGRKVVSISLGTGRSAECTVYERLFVTQPIKEGDIIQINQVYKNDRGYWYIGDYKVLSSS